METKLNQKEWLDFINRLQERERQKISSSGLSNWTLFAALAGLGYWILPEIPSIQKNITITILGYVFFHNLTISLFDIFNNLYRNKKILRYRFPKTELDKKGNLPLVLHEIGMLSIATLVNAYFIYFFLMKGMYIYIIYFGLYLFRYSYNLFWAIIALAYNYIKNNIDLSDIQDKAETTSNKKKSKFIANLLRIVLSTRIKLIVTFFALFYIWNHYTIEKETLKLALDGLALSLITILIQFLLMIFIKRLKIAWLENLEKEVILNNLTPAQIIQKLRLGYFNTSNIDIDNYF
ncbi:hypothetical protein ACFQ88_23225 [Paenibacillus sp. NPDC056579]|uniref:hypothetical protein n=1 Tax=Paenibacillus sp. NPDC056579 TaxID=3345871 RepID=UPI003691B5F4